MAAYNLPFDMSKRFDPLSMDPKEFLMPDLFTVVDDKMYHKFDEIYIFYSDAAGSMVVSFYLRGKQVMWTAVNMGSFRGELKISNLLGWQQLEFI